MGCGKCAQKRAEATEFRVQLVTYMPTELNNLIKSSHMADLMNKGNSDLTYKGPKCATLNYADVDKKNCLCTKEYEPVCDDKGNKYSNMCMAKCKGLEQSQVSKCKDDGKKDDDKKDDKKDDKEDRPKLDICGAFGSPKQCACPSGYRMNKKSARRRLRKESDEEYRQRIEREDSDKKM